MDARPEISLNQVNMAIAELLGEVKRRLEEKGRGTFASSHEILGIITEEYMELIDAIKLHGNDKKERIKSELFDVAVACVFGIACIDNDEMSWL